MVKIPSFKPFLLNWFICENFIFSEIKKSRTAINKIANPNATLDVNGNTIISGSLTVTGSINNSLGKVTSSAVLISGSLSPSFAVYSVPNNQLLFNINAASEEASILLDASTTINSPVALNSNLTVK